jgi:hypothetical protein
MAPFFIYTYIVHRQKLCPVAVFESVVLSHLLYNCSGSLPWFVTDIFMRWR